MQPRGLGIKLQGPVVRGEGKSPLALSYRENKMKRRTTLAVSVMAGTLLLVAVAGVAWARNIQCKPNTKCEGTGKTDFLTGTPKPDRIFGLGGGDFLFGLGRGDTLVGGGGADQLEGGAGDLADDTLSGGKGQDHYYFEGDWGDDRINDTGSADNDALTGNTAIFFGTDAVSPLTLKFAPDPGSPEVVYGSRTVNWGANAVGAVYVRTPGSDVITGSGVADYIESSESGAGGTDSISGGGGDDNIQNFDQDGADDVSGEGGNDYILNGDMGGADTVSGEDGDDYILNEDESGTDSVSGGAGNDEITSRGFDEDDDGDIDNSGGDDTVLGGEGDDTINVQDGFAGDTVDCGENAGGDATSPDDDAVVSDPGDVVSNCEN
jgi:Ca2+-binding RTX toxin-like protein